MKNILIFGTGSVVGFFLPEIVAVIGEIFHLNLDNVPLYNENCQYNDNSKSGTRTIKMGFCATQEEPK